MKRTDLVQYDLLPPEIREKAIEYAQKVTGIKRPVKEHAPLILAWEACFLTTKELILNSLGGTKWRKRK